MAVEKTHARLGLFLAVALVVVIATALLFIQRARNRAVIEMVTYTRENVSGLDVSSPVRYRGVPVGRVSELRVDPRARTIEIDFEVFLDRLNTIGANVELLRETADLEGIFPTLRAQVVGNPVTGEAYLLLDAPENPPPPLALGFTPDRPYVPSMPTPLAAIRDGCRRFSSVQKPRCGYSATSSPGFPTASTGATGSSPTSSASFSEQPAGAERGFAAVLRDDKRADRTDRLRAGRGDRFPRGAGHVR